MSVFVGPFLRCRRGENVYEMKDTSRCVNQDCGSFNKILTDVKFKFLSLIHI